MPKVATNCPACGIEFSYYPSWPRKYCSNKCSGKANAKNLKEHLQPLGAAPRDPCEECGGPIVGMTWQGRRFCSSRCWGDWQLVNAPRGAAHPSYGPRPLDKRKPVTRIVRNCPHCGTEFEVKQSHLARRRFCSKRCLGAWRTATGAMAGPNNARWRGGYLPYYGPSWHPARRAVLTRDKVCQDCGSGQTGLNKKQLDVHHITEFREFGLERHEEANEHSNLVALCHACHRHRHSA